MRAADRERGIAIVAALWGAAIIALIVLSVLQIVRADTRVGHSREDVTELNGIADAAVNITILSLLGAPATHPPINATPFAVPFADHTVVVSVQDEAGKIDLNMANNTTLRLLLLAAGLDTGSATELADRIEEWRGTNSRSASTSMPGAYAPRRAPFQSVEELQLVAGMTPELYRRIAPLVTVYSQTPWVDPAYSSVQVLNVFRAVDTGAAAALLRIEEERAGLRQPEPSPGVVLGHAFTITAEVTGPASARVTRTAVIGLRGQAQMPLLIYRWN